MRAGPGTSELADMEQDIANAAQGATTRRRALGTVAALLVGGALPLTASGAVAHAADAARRSDHDLPYADDVPYADDPPHPEEPHWHADGDVCTGGYDAGFEDALRDADERLGPDELRGLPEGPAPRYALPLRRGFRVSAAYGVRGDWLAGHHTGIDLAVPQGTPVYAVGAGTVLVAGWSGAYGNAVTIRLPDNHYALVAHLSQVFVRVGARVSAGTLLGRSGATGRATGPHLHLEVRAQRGYGSDIDPVGYLARRGVRLL